MARLYSNGFELQNKTIEQSNNSSNSNNSISTTIFHGGAASLEVNASDKTGGFIQSKFLATPTSNNLYFRMYYYLATYPSSITTAFDSNNDVTIAAFLDNSSSSWAELSIDATGVVRVYQDGSTRTVVGTSSALSTGQWYYIELGYGATNSYVEARINGTSIGSTTSAAGLVAINQIACGMAIFYSPTQEEANGNFYMDDIAVNDSTGSFQNSWPGAGKQVYLRPDAAGDSNTFLVTQGGTAGASNNYTRVNAVTPNYGSTYNASAALSASDLFAVGSSPLGASDTVNVVQIGGQYANLVAADTISSFSFQLEKTSGGIISKSSAIIPDSSSTYQLNGSTGAGSLPYIYPFTLYQDPDGSSWVESTINSMQIGYIIDAVGTHSIAISDVWALVDYTPSSGTLHTQSLAGAFGVAGGFFKQPDLPLAGSLALSGALAKSTDRSLAGSLEFAGILGKQIRRSVAGAFGLAGGFAKQNRLPLSGSLSLSGSFSRLTSALLSGSLELGGSLAKMVSRIYSGATSLAGSLVGSHLRFVALAGRLRLIGLKSGLAGYSIGGLLLSLTHLGPDRITKQVDVPLSGSLETSGTFSRSTSAVLSGTLNLTGSLVKRISRAFAGALGVVGTLTSVYIPGMAIFYQSLSGSFGLAGSLSKQTRYNLAGSTGLVGTLAKQAARGFNGAINLSGSFAKQANRILAGSLQMSGAISRLPHNVLSASLGLAGTINRFTRRLLPGASLKVTGTMTKRGHKSASGTLRLSGAIKKQPNKLLAGSLGFVGSLVSNALYKLSRSLPAFLRNDDTTIYPDTDDNSIQLSSDDKTSYPTTDDKRIDLGSDDKDIFL